MSLNLRILAAVLAGALATGLADASASRAESEPGSAGANSGANSGAVAQAQPSVGDIVIGEIERRILNDYYRRNAETWVAANPDYANGNKQKHKSLPPGIAKKGTLPPGIAKQLARNNQLPPGLAYRDLPPDLIAQLPPRPPAYRYVIVDDRVMLIQAATNVILDVLRVPGL